MHELQSPLTTKKEKKGKKTPHTACHSSFVMPSLGLD